ncbi:hypothetical protein BJD49_gp014 [Acinetobacter phage vB_AbaM_phiAbaA1]|nr:hypothetical protein BJD49_gp014 [Acinetobacter phage vB_AbaM_phiAbaA1]AJK27117.1 hypothetical protein phiAbaA1_014 [Acinetobacter phage vB_AbaM_phiAbaA1]
MEDDEDLTIVVVAIIAMIIYIGIAYFFLKTTMGAFVLYSLFGVIL